MKLACDFLGERDTVHEQGIIITNPLSTITILISIMQSSLLKYPLQWKYGNTPTVEMKVSESKNPAQGFHSIINNRVFYRCGVAVSD